LVDIIRTDKSVFKRWWWSVDRVTLTLLCILMIIGIMLVAAASPSVAERIHLNPFYFTNRQMLFMVPTALIMFITSFVRRKNLWRISSLIAVVSILLMICLLIMGFHTKGATRWISLLGFSLQPSEFVKPAFAVSCAWLMSRHQYEETFPGHQIAIGMFLLIVSLLLMQPDVGMTFVTCCIWAVEVFISGIPLILIGAIGAVGVVGLMVIYMTFPHFASRLNRFLNPASGDTYQVEKSIDAFTNGGLWGTGPGHGEVKMHLPDAHADFIFSVAGEEFGMIFVIILIAIFAAIIIRSVYRVFRNDDMFVVLASAGLLTQFGVQSLIHMGSSLQLLPAKGMTLPFISYGGSSLLSFGYAMGMLLSLTSKRMQNDFTVETRGGRGFNAK